MTADLVSLRLPLAERQYQSHTGRMNADRHSCLSYMMQPCSSNLCNPGATTETQSSVGEPVETITPLQTPTEINAQLNSVGVVYNGGTFKYQIRRPVESWKFVESHTSNGLVLYLCRVCNSSYKHKKSLNKHWKDKHADLPRPEGAVPDEEDDDDCEAEDEDSDFEPTPPPRLLPAHAVDQCSGDENRPPCDPLVLRQQKQQQQPPPPPHHQPSTTRITESSMPILPPSRRFSTPHHRVHKPLQSSRYSSKPQKHSSNRSTEQPQNKRFRFLESSTENTQPRQYGALSGVEKKTFAHSTVKESTKGVSLKGKESVERSSRHHPKSSERASIHGSSVSSIGVPVTACEGDTYLDTTSISTQRSMLDAYSVQTSSAVTPNHPSVIRGQRSPKEESCDFQPLDLSVQRTTTPIPIDSSQIASFSNNLSQCPDYVNRRKFVSKFLLIELLQTAINTLQVESLMASQHHQHQATVGDQQQQPFLTLSRKATSLLTAIGNLLVALVDGQSIGDEDQQLDNSSSVKSRAGTAGAKLAAHGLPPAPLVAIGGLAEELTTKTSMPDPSSVVDGPQSGSHRILVDEQHGDDGSKPAQTDSIRQFNGVQTTVPLTNSTIFGQTSSVTAVPGEQFSPAATQCSNLHHNAAPPMTGMSQHLTTYSPPVGSVNRPADHIHNRQQYQAITPPIPTTSEVHETSIIVCPVCQFEARWFSELRAHMVNHSDHRMFGCCYCTYRAKWKWDVAKHMRRCPLGRHIAHLTNEALLRMIRYFPPPTVSILYNYFPQDEFPGVGIDHPPTPPREGQMKSPTAAKSRPPDRNYWAAEVLLAGPTVAGGDRSQVTEFSRSKDFEDLEAVSPVDSPIGLVIVEGDEAADANHVDENTPGHTRENGEIGSDSVYTGTAALVNRQPHSTSQRAVLGELSSNTGISATLKSINCKISISDVPEDYKIGR